MKKILSVIICMVMILAAAYGCGKAGDSDAMSAHDQEIKDEAKVAEEIKEETEEVIASEMPEVSSEPEPSPSEEQTATEGEGDKTEEESKEESSSISKEEGTKLPLIFTPDWTQEGDHSKGTFFTYDINGDGEPEDINYSLNDDAFSLEIFAGKDKICDIASSDIISAVLIDMDEESPFVNLLITVDMGSTDYATVEYHYEDGRYIEGKTVYGSVDIEDGKLYLSEDTDILGTSGGRRRYAGDELMPMSEWLKAAWIPEEKDLKDEETRKSLLELGFLLEAVKDIPCEIDGKPAYIPAGSVLYKLRFRGDGTAVEVQIENGKKALIWTENQEYQYYIDGKLQDEYFKYVGYAG